MKVKDFIARFSDELMEAEVSGVIIVAVAEEAPMLASTMPPSMVKTLLGLVVEHGNWSDMREIKPN